MRLPVPFLPVLHPQTPTGAAASRLRTAGVGLQEPQTGADSLICVACLGGGGWVGGEIHRGPCDVLAGRSGFEFTRGSSYTQHQLTGVEALV